MSIASDGVIAADFPPNELRWGREQARSLWRLVNAPRLIDPRAVRVVCGAFTIGYASANLLRASADAELAFSWLRVAVLAYTIAGFLLARRFTWSGLCLYAEGLTLLFPLTALWTTLGSGGESVWLLAVGLANFVCLSFILSGRSFVKVLPLLIVGQGVIGYYLLPPTLSAQTLAALLIGTDLAGTVSGVAFIFTKATTMSMLTQWRASYQRELLLRRLAEAAAGPLRLQPLLERLVHQLARMQPDGRCILLLLESDDLGSPIIGLTDSAGLLPAKMIGQPLSAALRAFWRRMDAARMMVSFSADDDTVAAVHDELQLAPGAGGLIALSIRGFARGLLLQSTPAPFEPCSEDLQYWQVIAGQIGTAAASARSWEELEEREAMARQLSRTQADLSQRRSYLISTASHEFRTPLTVIQSATDALMRYSARITPDERHQRLEKIQREVEHLRTIMDGLITAGRAEAEEAELSLDPVDLTELTRQAIERLRTSSTDAARLALVSADAPVEIVADPILIRVILENLLSNALKYSPAGGPVECALTRGADVAVLRVRDYGIGIPEDERREIFQPFHRAANVGDIQGSGLGLATVLGAVERHGGSLVIDSHVGAGTTVTVTFPNVSALG